VPQTSWPGTKGKEVKGSIEGGNCLPSKNPTSLPQIPLIEVLTFTHSWLISLGSGTSWYRRTGRSEGLVGSGQKRSALMSYFLHSKIYSNLFTLKKLHQISIEVFCFRGRLHTRVQKVKRLFPGRSPKKCAPRNKSKIIAKYPLVAAYKPSAKTHRKKQIAHR
jgi:hypothetical protein